MSTQRKSHLAELGVQSYVRRGAAVANAAAVVQSSSPTFQARQGSAAPRIDAASSAAGNTEIALMDWDTLRNTVAGCTRCGLAKTRTQTVFGVGHERAEWFVIGEAPGADEDRLGEPFVGRAGQLLDSMLRAIDVKRGVNAYIGNILRCRPPNNREPTPEEALQCSPFLKRQIALVQPRIILVVGRIAAQNLLQTDTPIGKMRGRSYSYGNAGIPVVVTYHPAYLLRSPGEKRKAWADLKFARDVLRRGHG